MRSIMNQHHLTEKQVYECALTSYGSLEAAMRVTKDIEEEQANHTPLDPILQVGVNGMLSVLMEESPFNIYQC